jgi:hypothetical protein
MKNLRMVLTGALVIAIVGGSLAFTKQNPDLFQCVSNVCVAANFSSFNPNNGTSEVSVTDKYTTDNAANPVCLKAGSQTRGCKTNPAHAWAND